MKDDPMLPTPRTRYLLIQLMSNHLRGNFRKFRVLTNALTATNVTLFPLPSESYEYLIQLQCRLNVD